MRFLDLYESDKTTNQEDPMSIEKILGDLEHFHDNKDARAQFLNKIHRPGQQPDKAFTYGGDGSGKGAGGKSISYTADVGSNQPSEDFARIISKIKDGHPNWKKEIEEVINLVKNSNQQQYIKAYFIPKVENPGAKLTTAGNLKSDNRVPDVSDYEKLGKAMVFYAGKCVSKLTDADTKIGPDKFKEIMQGCFGAAPGNNGEDDSFLMQFKDIESKLKIDAAKNVIKSIHSAGTKDIDGIDFETESYYSGISYIVTNRLFEADEGNEGGSVIECPKTIDEFSKVASEALKQAKAVAEKYPKQYKLWYEKLRAAFDEGVEEYQKDERNPEKTEFVNPITGEKEHRHGKAWGTGGPNAFIRDNPDLQKIVDKIKQGTPGCEGVNGWDIFNCGPRLILAIFDALEKGGKIYQKLCDDIGEGMRSIKRSLGSTKPADFDKLIKKYADENEHARAMEIGLSGVLCSLANVYKILANGKIGQINYKTKTFNSENSGSETVIQVRIDELKNSLARVLKEKADYDKWKEEEDKKKAERIKRLEEEIAGLSKKKDNPEQKKEGEGKGNKEEPKKDGISVVNNSYVRKFSVKDILNEEETETKNQKKATSIQDELKKKKEELEKVKSGKDDKTIINLENYIAILDDYKQVLGLEPYIKEAYGVITLLFDPDAAEEQYQALVNKAEGSDGDNNEEEDTGSNTMTDSKLSLSARLENILKEYKLFEAEDGETFDSEENDDPEDGENKQSSGSAESGEKKEGASSAESGEKKKKETAQNTENSNENGPEVKSENAGNLDWTKRDQAQGLKAVYRIFGEGKDNVRFNMPVFRELAKAKTKDEALKQVTQVLANLNKTLNGLRPVEPVVDGIVACNKVENPGDIPGCIETIKYEEKNQEAQKEKEKPKEKEKENKKTKAEDFKEQRDNLIKLIDENSPIMKNVIGKMNDVVKNAKDDSWLNEYNSFVENFNNEGKKILDYLKEIYKGSEGGTKWLSEKEEALSKANVLVKMWLIVSMAKYVAGMLNNQIEQEEEEELKRQQQSGELQNSSYNPIAKNPELNEAAATKHTINVLLATVSENMKSLNFNDLLPTNYENDIYNLNAPDIFNKNEENFARSIRLDKVSGGNGIYAMLKQLITNETIADALKNANIKKCMEQINYLHSEKGNKESPDRNMFLYFGVIRAICSTLNNLDDDIKEIDVRDTNNDKRNGNKTGSTGKKNLEDAAETKQEGDKPNNSVQNNDKPQQQASYIPEFSPDSLINEIYKYIRGN